jgi:hypothetical protein
MKKRQVIILSIIVGVLFLYLIASQAAPSSKNVPVANGGGSDSTATVAQEHIAKQIMIEQQQSRENLRRLAEGQIKSLAIGNLNNLSPDQVQIDITANFTDGTSLPGRVDLRKVGSTWYLFRITRNANLEPGSIEDLVATVGGKELDIGKEIVQQQSKSQETITKLVQGEITNISLDNIVNKDNKATLQTTVTMKDGSTKAAEIKQLYYRGFWYIEKFTFK